MTQQDSAVQILNLLDELYGDAAKNFIPARGKVLVKLTEKDSVYKGLIAIPNAKHKPIYEAIIVATYKPYWKHVKFTNRDGEEELSEDILIEPQVNLGDHILFPHFKGAPVPMDEFAGEFRIIDETDIEGLVVYDSPILEQVEAIVGKRKAQTLLNKYVIISQKNSSLTRSGAGNGNDY